MLPHPTRSGREHWVSDQLRLAQRTEERHPLLVCRDRDRDPAIVPAVFVGASDLVEVLRRRARPAVATTGKKRTVSGVLDGLLRGDVDRCINHRCFDETAFASPIAVLEREHQAEQCVEPSVRVTYAV